MKKLLLIAIFCCFSGILSAQHVYTKDAYKAYEKKPWHKKYTKNGKITAETFRLYSVIFVFARDSFYYDTVADLDSLVTWMQENPRIRIELGVHISRCNPEASRLYSHSRAEYVQKYLLQKGIAPERIVARGYECSHPLIAEDEIKELGTEEERMNADRVNRRIEIRILDQ
ncbi:MAG: hypothetical protein IBJ09_10490 [Bacteroidia bacterium]|nr:hypothetical protein [Bacteroidia bacterium]